MPDLSLHVNCVLRLRSLRETPDGVGPGYCNDGNDEDGYTHQQGANGAYESNHLSCKKITTPYAMVETFFSRLTYHFMNWRNSVMMRPQTARSGMVWAF